MTVDKRKEAVVEAVRLVPDDNFSDYGGGWPGQISTALLDAVFSIRARYRAVNPKAGVAGRLRTFNSTYPDAITDLNALVELGSERVRDIMGSTVTAKRLKADAAIEAAEALVTAGVAHASDFVAADRGEMKRAYTSVRGLGAVTFEYFSMHLGVPGVKADTMITRFVNKALQTHSLDKVSRNEARQLVVDAHAADQRGAKSLTYFEHALWKFESDLAARRQGKPLSPRS